jgi:hypothetical protein
MFAKLSFSAAASGAIFLAGAGTGVSASPVQGIDMAITVYQSYNFLLLSLN